MVAAAREAGKARAQLQEGKRLNQAKAVSSGLGHTGLRRPLHQLVGERPDAFVGDGGQGEGVLRVGFQTLHRVRIPGSEGQFLLRDRRIRVKWTGATVGERGEGRGVIKGGLGGMRRRGPPFKLVPSTRLCLV